MKKHVGILVAVVVVLALPLIVSHTALAIQGACVNCHTMHNSQNGSAVNASGPYEYLLNNTCYGCHTGSNDGTSTTPYVMSSSEPTYGPDYDASGTYSNNGTTLAGGNFYWVVNVDDAAGHNVEDLAGADGTLTTPPGFQASVALPNGGTGPASWSGQVTCAGVYGCHGDRTVSGNMAAIKGAHHSNATGALTTADSIGNSYRFLLGIHGNEDSDYEYQPTNTAHNQYYGVDRTSETDLSDRHTISYFCAECHGDFHNGSGNLTPSGGSWGSPWLRHPTDYDMGNTDAGSEYRSYVGADGTTAGQYNVVAPVASSDVSSVKATVNFSDDTIVMCLSCHRAHGTKYADILRWDYSKMVAGNAGGYANKGCFACHTSKD